MKAVIELDVFQEMKLDEDTGEIIMRPIAEMMDAPLDYIDEKDEPKWSPLLRVLTEQFIVPYVLPDSANVPNKKHYHTAVAASEDLLKVAYDFQKNINDLHCTDN